jgi:hypothetical protein
MASRIVACSFFMTACLTYSAFSMIGSATDGITSTTTTSTAATQLDLVTKINAYSSIPSTDAQINYLNQILGDNTGKDFTVESKNTFKNAASHIWTNKGNANLSLLKLFLNNLKKSNFNFSNVNGWLNQLNSSNSNNKIAPNRPEKRTFHTTKH